MWPRRVFRRVSLAASIEKQMDSVALFVAILFHLRAFRLVVLSVVDGFSGRRVLCRGGLVWMGFSNMPRSEIFVPIVSSIFVASTLSPLEVAVRDRAVCDRCVTKDCIRGRRDTLYEHRSLRRVLP